VNGGVLAVAMLAALNPAARAARLRHLDDRRALLGALVTVAVVAAIAGLSGPLLDAGDISGPNVRVAAGLVLTAAGLVELVRGRGPEQDLPPGPWAAVVPVAFPVLLQPQVGLLALSAGADHGVAVTALAALGALVVFLAAGRVGTALLIPLGRLLGAMGVVAGTALVVDGVLSV
jgi:small neutral amino acid transporter SnatA (MarC family)